MTIEIYPSGIGLSCTVFSGGSIDMAALAERLGSDSLLPDPALKRSGFEEIQLDEDGLYCKFRAITPRQVESLSEEGREEIVILYSSEVCGILFTRDHVLGIGKGMLVRRALEVIAPIVGFGILPVKFETDAMWTAYEHMELIKSIHVSGLTSPGYAQLRVSGKFEDIDGFEFLGASTGTLKSISGRLKSPFGYLNIRLSDSGKIQIYGGRDEPVPSDYLQWLTLFMTSVQSEEETSPEE